MPSWERLAPGVARCRVTEWDATVGLVWGHSGAALIDCGASVADGEELRLSARSLAGGDVTALVLTHPHFDHILGAGAFADVPAYGGFGIESVRACVADAVRHGVDPGVAERSAAAVRAIRPVDGGRRLDLGVAVEVVDLGRAHSAADLAVIVESSPRIVFTGDLVEESGPPQAGPDADRDGWPAALHRLLELGGDSARYVPGHGAVVDAGFVRAQAASLQR